MPTIYAIFDKDDNAYVGCTAGKLQKRMREHRCLLRAREHKCVRFQQSWIANCGEGFRIQSLEECLHDVRRDREVFWMELFKAEGRLFNEHVISFSPPEGAPAKAAAARVRNGYRQSAESNLKRRLAQLGKPKGHGAKISATKRAKR